MAEGPASATASARKPVELNRLANRVGRLCGLNGDPITSEGGDTECEFRVRGSDGHAAVSPR
jgi:hypothetical protein